MKRLASFPGMAPAVGPFSQAVVAGGFVFTTGQIPLISGTDDRPADFSGSVRQVLRNLELVLLGAGSTLAHVVTVTTYLSSPDQFEEYDSIFAEVFGAELPARTSVCVGIWDFTFEIQCIAVLADEAGA